MCACLFPLYADVVWTLYGSKHEIYMPCSKLTLIKNWKSELTNKYKTKTRKMAKNYLQPEGIGTWH